LIYPLIPNVIGDMSREDPKYAEKNLITASYCPSKKVKKISAIRLAAARLSDDCKVVGV
jgi:hypothetical protein